MLRDIKDANHSELTSLNQELKKCKAENRILRSELTTNKQACENVKQDFQCQLILWIHKSLNWFEKTQIMEQNKTEFSSLLESFDNSLKSMSNKCFFRNQAKHNTINEKATAESH